jgi:hypothetical protein
MKSLSAGLGPCVFDIHSVLVMGIIRYKENDLFQLGLLERTIPSDWTNFWNWWTSDITQTVSIVLINV